MSFNHQFLATALAIGCVSPLGAYTLGTGYQSSVLASTVTAYDYTQFEGISKSGDTLYVGNFRSVKQYDLSSGTYSDYGTVPGNNGISHVTYANGTVYASGFTSYSAPYPYTMYTVGAGDNTSAVLTMGGIYDAAVSPAGQFYFVANPDVDADDEGDGSRLYRMDLTDNSLTEIAYLGGASGGIAFDQSGNLFYAHYDNGVIYSFSASDLLVGSLELSDATPELLLANAGYIDFDADGNLVASHLDTDTYETTISRYDVASGELIDDIFTGTVGGFLCDGDTIYVNSQSWDFMGDYGSELLALSQVPEPSAYALVFAGLAGLVLLRRRRRA